MSRTLELLSRWFRPSRKTSSQRRKSFRRLWSGLENLEKRTLMVGDVAGTLIHDINENGQKDLDEVGLSGWKLFIDLDKSGTLSAGDPVEITNVDGDYLFTGIPAGSRTIYELLPSGWAPTAGALDHQSVKVISDTEVKANFFNNTAQVGSIEGVVWNDTNGDGLHGITETGLANWTLYLDDNNNSVQDIGEASTISSADGRYVFSSVHAGDHRVREVLPIGWEATEGHDSQYNITVVTGVTAVVDFYNLVPNAASISGNVANDLNGSGVTNAGNPGLSGWQVYVDLNNDSLYTLGEPTATSDSSGNYTILGVRYGAVTLREVVQAGWSPTNPATGSRVLSLLNGDAVSNINFLNMLPTPGSVSGKLWNDFDGNGVIGVSEAPLAGWQVYVDANNNGTLDATDPNTTTDATGAYTLSGLTRGNLTIRDVVQPGWLATTPSTSAQAIALLNGENLANLNFGNKERAESSISGVAFVDANANGLRDAGEKGLAGLTIYLDMNDSGTLDGGEPSMVSSNDLFYTPGIDETGVYKFDRLPKGSYTIREILPAELNATPSTVASQTLVLGPADATHIDFANRYRPSEIHGTVFDDVDGDRVHDAGEAVRAGVTVFLDLDRDDTLDADEPSDVTDGTGSYSFSNLSSGAYVVREIVSVDREHTYPNTTGGTLWPSGMSNPAQGNVTPSNITTSLAIGQSHRQNVSITLPGSGGLTNMVDVFLLFDDTGSFTANSPLVRAAFPTIISTLQSSLSGIDLGFGVGRLEEYANFASEYGAGRPFILNQPIVASSTPGFSASIQAALDRTAPGYGGDQPETDIEALYQLVTGRGFDGNNNGSLLDSGPAGLTSTQVNPGSSGDVPPFASFTTDIANNVLPAAGNVGGGGFRAGALPVVLLATDTGFAYQPKGESNIVGTGGVTLPLSSLTQLSRNTTPYSSGAGIQETVTGLNALGALVIGLGTNAEATLDPRQQLESLAKLTGAINRSTTTIANGTTDTIAPGDPFYFQISSGFGSTVANGVVNAIQNAVTNVAMDITLKASDPRVTILNHTGTVANVIAGGTASFDLEFVGDGIPHRFDLQFVRAGTNVVLGSIPIVLGTPIPGECYDFTELEDGEIASSVEFGDHALAIANHAPTDMGLSGGSIAETAPLASLVGTFSTVDSDAGDTFTYSFAAGSGDTDNALFKIVGDQLLSNALFDFNVQKSYSVRVATKDAAGSTLEKTFTIAIEDVNTPPSLEVSGPLDGFSGVRGQMRSFSLITTDDATGGFTYEINWGDGSPLENLSGGSTLMASHAYATNASYNATFRVIDVGGLPSSTSTKSLTILASETQGNVLAWGGTSGDDAFVLTPSSTSPQVKIVLNAATLGILSLPSGGLALYGNSGNDSVTITGTGGVDSFTADESSIAWGGSTLWPGGFNTVTNSLEVRKVLALGGNDTITVISGQLNADGGTGTDTLNLAALSDNITVDLQAKTVNGRGSFIGVENFIGGTGANTLIGANAVNAWTISGTNAGKVGTTTWSHFGHLQGGTLSDTFTYIGTASMTAGVDGALGNDTLVGSNLDSRWNITSPDAGDINGMAFSQIENLSGGTLNDFFQVAPSGSLTGWLKAGTGYNALSYADWTTGVLINASTNLATGIGSIVGATFSGFIGGSGNDSITAANKSSVLVGGAGNDVLMGNGQRDILFGGLGQDTLNGAGGDDLLFGGVTGYESLYDALFALLTEWKSTNSYGLRIEHLRGITPSGLNCAFILTNSPLDSLIDDNQVDTLVGATGRDWYIAAVDDLLSGVVTSGASIETLTDPNAM